MAKKKNASWYAWLGLVFSSILVFGGFRAVDPVLEGTATDLPQMIIAGLLVVLMVFQGTGAMFLMMGMSFPPTNRPWIVDTENLDRAVFFYGLFAFAIPVITLAFFPKKARGKR